jgi:predicted dienelactone hydrolase
LGCRPGLRLKGLLLGAAFLLPLLPRGAGAAELLQVRIDTLQIPIHLDQLQRWSRLEDAGREDTDLSPWLALLEPRNRAELRRMLQAPLLRDRSFGSQLLDSWAGGQLLAELGNLLTTPEGESTTTLLQTTLRRLLEQRRQVTLLELLEALPPRTVHLQLDGLLSLGQRWRQQLRRQQRALVQLRQIPLPPQGSEARGGEPSPPPGAAGRALPPPPAPLRLTLATAGRPQGLPLEIWSPPPADRPSRPWIVMMPGLGGNADQLGWLAAALAQRGWPVVVLQHPGSDGPALKAALEGQRPPPGAETLPSRLADLEAVLAAQRAGQLPLAGDGVVLAGHSLGALTALWAAGLAPAPGLEQRCRQALDRLPIHNPSRLIQCQLPERKLPRPVQPPPGLRGLVLFNAFGSLLWPADRLAALPVPLLMVGGSLDLVTPPLDEQLALFVPSGDPRSRLAVVLGGSHFSPLRLAERDEALLRVGHDLVGADPRKVQALLLQLTADFLRSLEGPQAQSGGAPPRALGSAGASPLPAQRRQQGGIQAFVLDPLLARRWFSGL